jgi:hypothetical protein
MFSRWRPDLSNVQDGFGEKGMVLVQWTITGEVEKEFQ